jgi:CheY-like chemotaxis protein
MPDDTRAEAARSLFIQQLRTALNGLYDPAVLGRSALARVFQVDQRRDKVFALRDLLTQAIEAMRPREQAPADTRTWRVYQILRGRYIEQLPQPEVAADLNLSLRQLQREESAAREVLADYLWADHALHRKTEEVLAAIGEPAEPGVDAPTLNQELEWLGRSAPIVPADVGEVIAQALATIRPIADAAGVVIAEAGQRPPLRLNLQAAVLRQALINVGSAAVSYAPAGHLHIAAQTGPGELTVDVQAEPCLKPCAGSGAASDEGLKMAGDLLRISRGTLHVLPESEPAVFHVRMTLPVSRPATVLVIDDNADTLQLFNRYLAGSRYQFVGAQNARQGLELAEEALPQVIVLDVMMPGQDGWMLLGQFREYPPTRGIPVIICTVVPQEQLALSLGAAQFLRKPITRTALLAALDRQLDEPPKATG